MTETQSQPSGKSRLMRLLPLVTILAVAVLGAIFLRDTLSFETLRQNREALLAVRDDYYVLTLVAFVAIYTVIVTFSLPGAAIASITGGFLFALFPGVLVNVIAATLGASFIFLAARWGLGARLAQKMENAQGAVKKIKDGIDENQWSFLFMVRLLPIFPFFLVNLALSFVGVPLSRFVISTFLGIIPGALVFTSIGAGLSAVFAAGETPDLGVVFTAPILLPLIGLAALSAMPIAVKYFSRRNA